MYLTKNLEKNFFVIQLLQKKITLRLNKAYTMKNI